MKTQIPLLRVFVEGVVIVGSILLAFGIDAWWDERQEREEEREILSAITETVDASREVVQRRTELIRADNARAASFYAASDSELSELTADSLRLIINALTRPNTDGFSQGPLASLVSSGRTRIIRDDRVHAVLDLWTWRVSELEERAVASSTASDEALKLLTDHDTLQRGALAGAWQSAWSPTNSITVPSTWDVRSVRQDPELKSAVSALVFLRGIYLRNTMTLNGILDQIDQAVEAYVSGGEW